jgi:hypothetical protein
MIPEAYISHVSTGRMRIKIPSKKGDSSFFSGLKDEISKFSEFPGIQKVEVNPTTGSMLVTHNLDLNPAYLTLIKGYIEQKNLFKFKPVESSPRTPLSGNIAETFKKANKELVNFTKGELDVRSLATIGFLGLGIVQLSRGQFMIPAISAFWYASNLLKDSPKDDNQESKANNQEVKDG